MKTPINNFHDALNEWNNGELKNVPPHFITSMITILQTELERRLVVRLTDAKFGEYEEAWKYCCRKGYEPDNNADALQLWHDSDEYATEQAERKGDDDYTAGKEDW